MRRHAFAGGNGGGSARSRKADPRALLGAGSTRQLLVHEHYRSRISDHCPAGRSQGDGNLECRVLPGIPGDCRVAPKCFQHQHRHGAFDRRSARCVGFLDLFLPVLPALESCAFASDLRDTPHPGEPGSVLPRRRLLGIALSYGAARLHLLEHRGGSHGESAGGYAWDGYVRDANCRDCVRCFSSGALGRSNRMARFAQATQMASREPGSCRVDVCGGLRRDRFFRFVPTPLGSLGPLHAHAGGWLGHCARLLCSV